MNSNLASKETKKKRPVAYNKSFINICIKLLLLFSDW